MGALVVLLLGLSVAVGGVAPGSGRAWAGEEPEEKERLLVEGGELEVRPAGQGGTPAYSDGFMPGARTVIPRERFRDGMHTVADVLEEVPGVTLVRSGGALAPTGVSIRGSSPDQVLIVWDGEPLGTGLNPDGGSGAPTGVDLAAIPLDGVERLEVLRGAASSQYGPGAAAGVVIIHSRRDAVRQAALALTGGSAHYRELDARWVVPLGSAQGPEHAGPLSAPGEGAGVLGWHLNHRRSGGDYVYHDPTGASAGRCAESLGGGYYRRGCNSRQLTSLDVFHQRAGSRRLKLDLQHSLRQGLGGIMDPRPHGRETRSYLGLGYRDGLPLGRKADGAEPAGLLNWSGSLREGRVERNDNTTLGQAGLAADYRDRKSRLELWREDRGDWGFSRLGGEVERHDLKDRYFRAGRLQQALYAAWSSESPRWSAEASARAGHTGGMPAGNGRAHTWRMGGTRLLAGGLGLKASAATGYRPPTLYELYDPGSPDSGITVANEGLLPERTRTFDGGLFHDIPGAVYFEALYFRQEARDDIVALADPANPGLFRLDNVSATHGRGWEVLLNLRGGKYSMAPAGLELDAGMTRMEALITDNGRLDPRDEGNLVPGSPRLRWNAGASWRRDRWSAFYRVRHSGRRYLDTANTRFLKPYRLHEAGLSLHAGKNGGGFGVALLARNITNETYTEVENQPAPGRQLFLTLRWGREDRRNGAPPGEFAPEEAAPW
ncbi:MAG: TonB-dependent receptor [Deltaproteobacteria bacterium]|nr:TonB-dependent receptor [Deltaproteobacteria bacterium]